MAEIRRHVSVADDVMALSDSEVPFNMVLVNCSAAKQFLHDKSLELARLLLMQVSVASNQSNVYICERYTAIKATLSKRPSRGLVAARGSRARRGGRTRWWYVRIAAVWGARGRACCARYRFSQ